MCVENLKSVALPVPELTGGIATSQKIGAVPGYTHSLYHPQKTYMFTIQTIYLCALVFPRF